MTTIHSSETDRNHYVILSDGPTDYYWDCYSQVEGKWTPTCRQVRLEYFRNGEWAVREAGHERR